MTTQPSKPTVLVYRDVILPYSETFVAAQARGLQRFRPVLVGAHRLDGISLGQLEVITATRSKPPATRLARLRRPPFDEATLALLAEESPCLIHAHFGPDGLVAERLARALNIPLMVTFHGYDASRSTSLRYGPRRWAYGKRIPGLTRRAAKTVAVSEHIRQLLIARGCAADDVVTHHIGIDTAAFSPRADATEAGLVLAVGRFVEKKGFSDLIEAFANLRSRQPHSRLVILGDGEKRVELERQAAGTTNVSMPGSVDATDVRRWLTRAAVLVAPSVTAANGDTEGLPTIVVEAMASGVPVVATHHAGIPEAVVDGTTGLLVPERSPRELAQAIERVITDDATARRFSAAGVARASQYFDLRTQTALLERIYADVAAAGVTRVSARR